MRRQAWRATIAVYNKLRNYAGYSLGAGATAQTASMILKGAKVAKRKAVAAYKGLGKRK